MLYNNREILTITQAIAKVGISRRTMYNWINKGKVEYIRTPGGNIRIFEDSLFKTDTHLNTPVVSTEDLKLVTNNER